MAWEKVAHLVCDAEIIMVHEAWGRQKTDGDDWEWIDFLCGVAEDCRYSELLALDEVLMAEGRKKQREAGIHGVAGSPLPTILGVVTKRERRWNCCHYMCRIRKATSLDWVIVR